MAVKIAGKVDKSLGNAVSAANGQLGTFAGKAQKAASGLNSLIKKISLTAVALFALRAIKSFLSDAVNTFLDYQSTVAETVAIFAASAEDQQRLENAALAASQTTTKTATEAMQALGYMATAGWSVKNSLTALQPVLRLSEAANMDLATCSSYVTDTMAALGLQVCDITEYFDVLTEAGNASNAKINELMEAYIGCGGTMASLNVEVQDSCTALGILANRGIKGSEAGTKLQSVLLRLTSGTGEAGQMMQKLGISAFDSNGDFRGIYETLQLINKATVSMTDKQKTEVFAALGGKTQIDTLNALLSGINTVGTDGVSEWRALNEELYNSEGAMEAMADTMTNTLSGKVSKFKAAFEALKVNLVSFFEPAMKKIVMLATDAVSSVASKLGDIKNSGGLSGWISSLTTNIAVADSKAFVNNLKATAAAVKNNIAPSIAGMFGDKIRNFMQTVLPSIMSWLRKASSFVAKIAGSEGVQSLLKSVRKIMDVLGKFKGKIFAWLFDKLGDFAVWAEKNLLPGISEVMEKVGLFLEEAVRMITILFDNLKEGIDTFINKSGLKEFLDFLGTFFSGTLSELLQELSELLSLAASVLGLLNDLMTGDWSSAGKNFLRAIWVFVQTFLNRIIGILNIGIDIANSMNLSTRKAEKIPYIGDLPGLASGGIVRSATPALIGEGGEPEAVMPLSKLASLLEEYGGRGSGQTFVYSPQQTFSGNVSADDIKAANAASFEDFKRFMERYTRENKRKSFG